MITKFKIFEHSENTEIEMINDMFSRCDNKKYMKYISSEDPELFVVDGVFDEYESKINFLKDVYDIEIENIENNYIVSFGEFNDEKKKIIGKYPVLLYHYTSSTLLPNILKNGLIKGFHKTNPQANSYSGVYLTTEMTGYSVKLYAKISIQKHGGDGIRLYIKKYLSNIVPDPDDADLRSGKFQFITDHVSPNEIIYHTETKWNYNIWN